MNGNGNLELEEDKITPEVAKEILDRDHALTEADRRKLKQIMKRASRIGKSIPMAGKGVRVGTVGPNDFEGTFDQKQRRMRIYHLKMEGATIREMSKETGHTKTTVIRDLRAIDAALEKALDTSLATRFLNRQLLDLDTMRLIAMEGVRDSEGNARVGFLNTAAAITEKTTTLLQDAGIIYKAPSNHQLSGPNGEPLPVATGMNVRFTVVTKQKPEYKIVDVPAE